MNITLPSHWNQLSQKQMEAIALIIYRYEKKAKTLKGVQILLLNQIFYRDLLRQLLRHLNPIKMWVALRQIPPKEYLPFVMFLYKDVNRTHFPKRFSIRKGLKRVTFYPPYDRHKNSTVAEFSFADALFYNFRTKGKMDYLDMLCATLYRPLGDPKNITDIRQPFSKMAVENALPYFRKLSLRKKLAIAVAFEGSRNHKVGLYPNVFPKLSPEQAKQQGPSKYVPFGELVSNKIKWDPSKLENVENMLMDKFLGVYENELRESKK